MIEAALLNKRAEHLGQWLKTPLGRAVLETETSLLSSFLKRIVPGRELILGDLAYDAVYRSDAVHHSRMIISSYPNSIKAEDKGNFFHLSSPYETLPIEPESMDRVILPHTLEFTIDPYRVLRQATLALHPYGYLIIIGFNPLSLWGLRRLFSLKKTAPWSGSFHCLFRICDWLNVLNFDRVEQRRALYIPPFSPLKIGIPFAFLNRLFFSWFSGIYMIVAQKNRYNVTPLLSRIESLTLNSLTQAIPRPAMKEKATC